MASNEKAADLIAALGSRGLRVYQSNFEKRELVELFLNEAPQSGAEPIAGDTQ